MKRKFSVTYQGEGKEWVAIEMGRGQFAVSSPEGANFGEVKQFIQDLKEYLGIA